jgi:hypothetical protein
LDDVPEKILTSAMLLVMSRKQSAKVGLLLKNSPMGLIIFEILHKFAIFME